MEDGQNLKRLAAVTAISFATVSGAAAETVREAIEAMPEGVEQVGSLEYCDDFYEIYRCRDLPKHLPIDPSAGVEQLQAGGTIAVQVTEFVGS